MTATAVQGSSTKLYSPRLLALSAELANFPFDAGAQFIAERRSRTCGSTIKLGIDCDEHGRVSAFGLQLAACAVGQSSAAIMARGLEGIEYDDLARAVKDIQNWLERDGPLPTWRDFDALAAAHAHTGRHEALLLPWKAALEALSSGNAPG